MRSGCWVSTRTWLDLAALASKARTGRAHHRLAADRDQRLQIGAVSVPRTDRGPGREPASSSAVQPVMPAS